MTSVRSSLGLNLRRKMNMVATLFHTEVFFRLEIILTKVSINSFECWLIDEREDRPLKGYSSLTVYSLWI